MDEAARMRGAPGSNVFLGGTPASERFHTSSAGTYVDTLDMLVDEASSTAKLRRKMQEQGQVQHFELGAVELDYKTSGFQADHFKARTDEERQKMAADARLHAFKKKDMQAKHFELGLKKTNYTSLAAASFRWDEEAATKESASTKAEAKERQQGAQKTNFFMGAVPTKYTSEAAAAFKSPGRDPRNEGERLPPAAKQTNVAIGLQPLDYVTTAQATNGDHVRARAEMKDGLRWEAGGAGLRAHHWDLGLDDNAAEGHYTSQTMRDLWHVRVPEGKGVGAAAVRTVSAYKDRRVIPPALADDSPEFMAALKSMRRRPLASDN